MPTMEYGCNFLCPISDRNGTSKKTSDFKVGKNVVQTCKSNYASFEQNLPSPLILICNINNCCPKKSLQRYFNQGIRTATVLKPDTVICFVQVIVGLNKPGLL